MYTAYTHVPAAVRRETRWDHGWNSCLLFSVNLLLLTLYAIMPGVSLGIVLATITIIAALAILSAMISIVSSKFWLSKIYAICSLIGNVSMLLWLLLSL